MAAPGEQNKDSWRRDLANPDWWITLLTGGLLVVVPLAFYPGFDDPFSPPKTLLTQGLLSLGLAVWALAFIAGKIDAPKDLHFVAPLGVLLLVILTSCIRSPFRDFSLQQAEYFICGLLWALLVISWRRGTEYVRLAFVLASVAATVVAGIAVLQWVGFDPFLSSGGQIDWGTMVARMHLYSTFGNPDLVAGYLIGAFFPTLALAMNARKPWGAGFAYASAATILAAIIGTGSRGAWAGIVAGFVVGRAMWKRRVQEHPRAANATTSAGKIVAAGFAMLAMLCAAVLVRYEPLANTLSRRLEGRSFLWRSSWPMVWNHPVLGSGWGVFQLHFLDLQANFLAVHDGLARYWTNAHHLDNDLLQLLLETGVVGLAAFLWMLWAFGRELQKVRDIGSAKTWIAASASGVTAILVDSLFNAQFEVAPTLLLLFTLLAFPTLLASEVTHLKAEHPPEPAINRLPEPHQEASRKKPIFAIHRIVMGCAILIVSGVLAL